MILALPGLFSYLFFKKRRQYEQPEQEFCCSLLILQCPNTYPIVHNKVLIKQHESMGRIYSNENLWYSCRKEVSESIFLSFREKIYIDGIHKKRLDEGLLMSNTTYVFVEK